MVRLQKTQEYDSDEFVEVVEKTTAVAVIPPRRNRKEQREYDRELYKEQFRRIATRYEKLKRNYQSMLYLVSVK